jgi:hypothetical protein
LWLAASVNTTRFIGFDFDLDDDPFSIVESSQLPTVSHLQEIMGMLAHHISKKGMDCLEEWVEKGFKRQVKFY